MNSLRLCLSLFLALASSLAEEVGWHDSLNFIPGRGLDPRNPEQIMAAVAVIDTNRFETTGGGGGTTFSSSFSQHQFDLVTRLNLNVAFAVKGFLGDSHSFRYSFLDDRRYGGNTVNFVLEGSRRFAGKAFKPQALTADFEARAKALKATLPGVALHEQLVREFGSHFVSGFKKEAKVVVVYQFTFGSTSVARQLQFAYDGDYGAGPVSVDLDATVQEIFQRKDTTFALSYAVYSSSTSVPFPRLGRIETLDGYEDFSAKVQAYLSSLTEDEVKPSAYLTEPLANLPGYRTLVPDFSPTNLELPDYSNFLKVYSRLRYWQDLLEGWTVNPQRMSWLNDVGRQQVNGMRVDVANYLNYLKQVALDHFKHGSPLTVTGPVFNYFANLARIPVPSVRIVDTVIDNGGVQDGDCGQTFGFIGYVDAGDVTLTKPNPFFSVVGLRDGIEEAAGIGGDLNLHSPDEFQSKIPAWTETCLKYRYLFETFFKSERWTQLRAAATQRRIAFFWGYVARDDRQRWAIGVKDGANIFTEIVPCIAQSTASPGLPGAGTESSEVSVHAYGTSAPTTVGRQTHFRLIVTNEGPSVVYGVTLTLSGDTNQFEFTGADGSQGFGLLKDSQVVYEVGPLAAGSYATVNLHLIPLQVGAQSPAGHAVAALGAGLIDVNPNNNQVVVASLEPLPPELSLSRVDGFIELRWHSDTSRLRLEAASAISPDMDWQPVPATFESSLGERTVREPAPEQRRFFRLNLKD